MEEDVKKGLIPFFVCCTYGTPIACTHDYIEQIAKVAQQYTKPCRVWVHVDGAYAGNSFIMYEKRNALSKGIALADSFNVNPNKWLLTNFDCTCLWLKNRDLLIDALKIDAVYLNHHDEDNPLAIDYRHWGVPLSRRFRSLKLWLMFRCYTMEGLEKYIRNHIELAEYFKWDKLNYHKQQFEISNDADVSTSI